MGDIVSGIWDNTVGAAIDFVSQDIVSPIVNAVEQIPVVGDVVKAGVGAVNDVTSFLGPVGTLAASFALPGIGSMLGMGGSIAGAEGAIMSAEEIQAAMDAGNYSIADIAAATGNTPEVVQSVLDGTSGGGLGLQVANQAAFSPASSLSSSLLSGAKSIGNVAKVGTQLYNAFNPPNTQTPTQAQNSADPNAPYRAGYANELNQLVANPSSIISSGGYQAGLNQALTGTQRQLAQTGQSMSGMGNYNMALTSGDYFNTQFNQQYNRLAQLSGATQAPSVGQSANAAQQTLNATSNANQQRYIADAATGIQDLMKSYWG